MQCLIADRSPHKTLELFMNVTSHTKYFRCLSDDWLFCACVYDLAVLQHKATPCSDKMNWRIIQTRPWYMWCSKANLLALNSLK